MCIVMCSSGILRYIALCLQSLYTMCNFRVQKYMVTSLDSFYSKCVFRVIKQTLNFISCKVSVLRRSKSTSSLLEILFTVSVLPGFEKHIIT
jgi:hypothetical protein